MNTYSKKLLTVVILIFNLKKKSSTETMELVNISSLNKKQIKIVEELDIVNDDYYTQVYISNYLENEIFDNPYNTLRRHLNIKFPDVFTKVYI